MPGLPPFERVVREHGPVVLRVCRALVGAGDADDAWQETFLAALRVYPGLDPSTNLQAWLVTVAHHRCVDLLRARTRRAVPVAEPPGRSAGRGPERPSPPCRNANGSRWLCTTSADSRTPTRPL
jgi:DNA-directed RNA polymerase specialized sigma24 family protein